MRGWIRNGARSVDMSGKTCRSAEEEGREKAGTNGRT